MALCIQLMPQNTRLFIWGSGRQARRKAADFIEEGAAVIAAAPDMGAEWADLRALGVTTITSPECYWVLAKNCNLFFAASASPEENARLLAEARERGMMCIGSSACEEGSARFIKAESRGELTVAVGTGGHYPALASPALQGLMPSAEEYARRLAPLAELRPRILSLLPPCTDRTRLLKQLCYCEEADLKALACLPDEQLIAAAMEHSAAVRPQSRRAILFSFFGSSVPEAMEHEILPLYARLCADTPGFEHGFALTSPTIRKIWGERGRRYASIAEELEHLKHLGCEDIIAFPMLMLPGYEYDKLKVTLAGYPTAVPLLYNEQQTEEFADLLTTVFEAKPGRAWLLVGHGTDHNAHGRYAILQKHLTEAGRDDIYICTIEGDNGLELPFAELKAQNCLTVAVAPLLLTAGDHARNDILGEEDNSIANRLRAEGFTVEPVCTGLAAYSQVRELFADRLVRFIKENP